MYIYNIIESEIWYFENKVVDINKNITLSKYRGKYVHPNCLRINNIISCDMIDFGKAYNYMYIEVENVMYLKDEMILQMTNLLMKFCLQIKLMKSVSAMPRSWLYVMIFSIL